MLQVRYDIHNTQLTNGRAVIITEKPSVEEGEAYIKNLFALFPSSHAIQFWVLDENQTWYILHAQVTREVIHE